MRGVLLILTLMWFVAPPAMTVASQSEQSTASAGADPEFVKWAFTQGGLVLVVLILGWSYRRDMLRIAAKDGEKIELLTELVRDASTAVQASTSQSAATEKSIHRLARAIEVGNNRLAHVVPGGRREYDPDSSQEQR